MTREQFTDIVGSLVTLAGIAAIALLILSL